MERDYSFDFIKGFLIILVVLGHSIYSYYGNESWYNPIFNIIYTFHMPLFIFVSGYFFQSCMRRSFPELVKHRFKRLLLPTMIYTSILLLMFGVSVNFKLNSLWEIYGILRTYWYLICLFVLTILYYIFLKSPVVIKSILIITYIISIIFYEYLPVLILKDCQIIRMTLIFGLGIAYRYNTDRIHQFLNENRLFLYLFIFACFGGILLIRLFYGINMTTYQAPIRIIDGIACSMIAFIILKKTFKPINRYCSAISKHLCCSGTKSLGIYLIHMILIKFISYLHVDLTWSEPCIVIGSLFIIVYLISFLITKSIKNTKLKFLLLGE